MLMKENINGLQLTLDTEEGEHVTIENTTPREFIGLDMESLGELMQCLHLMGQWIAQKQKDREEKMELERRKRMVEGAPPQAMGMLGLTNVKNRTS